MLNRVFVAALAIGVLPVVGYLVGQQTGWLLGTASSAQTQINASVLAAAALGMLTAGLVSEVFDGPMGGAGRRRRALLILARPIAAGALVACLGVGLACFLLAGRQGISFAPSALIAVPTSWLIAMAGVGVGAIFGRFVHSWRLVALAAPAAFALVVVVPNWLGVELLRFRVDGPTAPYDVATQVLRLGGWAIVAGAAVLIALARSRRVVAGIAAASVAGIVALSQAQVQEPSAPAVACAPISGRGDGSLCLQRDRRAVRPTAQQAMRRELAVLRRAAPARVGLPGAWSETTRYPGGRAAYVAPASRAEWQSGRAARRAVASWIIDCVGSSVAEGPDAPWAKRIVAAAEEGRPLPTWQPSGAVGSRWRCRGRDKLPG